MAVWWLHVSVEISLSPASTLARVRPSLGSSGQGKALRRDARPRRRARAVDRIGGETMAKNLIRKVWEEGRAAYGSWLVVPGSFGAELMARVGVDYVCVDGQHGILGYDAMVPMFQAISAAGVAPITRVVQNDPGEIGKALDAGAWGVIVPLVSNAQEAARAVAACRYPPRGMRSYGPVRASAATGLSDPDELGAEALCLVMVETREGLNNVEEIAATPGLDGIYIGPGDLAQIGRAHV